jgi:hypothetical protein
MSYLREHKEAGHSRGLALVVGEAGRFCVRLIEEDLPWFRSHDGLHNYPSRDLAFAAADALARHRLMGHECSSACTEWVEP